MLAWIGGEFDPDAFDKDRVVFDDPQERLDARIPPLNTGAINEISVLERLDSTSTHSIRYRGNGPALVNAGGQSCEGMSA
jgi:hypothetical protein